METNDSASLSKVPQIDRNFKLPTYLHFTYDRQEILSGLSTSSCFTASHHIIYSSLASTASGLTIPQTLHSLQLPTKCLPLLSEVTPPLFSFLTCRNVLTSSHMIACSISCFITVLMCGILRAIWLISTSKCAPQTSSGKHATSRSLLNPIGTYQGSALGPLLYPICANDLSL